MTNSNFCKEQNVRSFDLEMDRPSISGSEIRTVRSKQVCQSSYYFVVDVVLVRLDFLVVLVHGFLRDVKRETYLMII